MQDIKIFYNFFLKFIYLVFFLDKIEKNLLNDLEDKVILRLYNI